MDYRDYDWDAYKDERHDIYKDYRDYDFFVEEETEATPYRIYCKPRNGDNDGCEVLNVDKFGEFYWASSGGSPSGEKTYKCLSTLTDKIPSTVFFVIKRKGIIQDYFIASLTYYDRYEYDIDDNQIYYPAGTIMSNSSLLWKPISTRIRKDLADRILSTQVGHSFTMDDMYVEILDKSSVRSCVQLECSPR